ncbi:GNAT family acetyltransferase [Planotetraspora thailandica]|uniref:GNAT family acetyltransferase n=1 Tax=Planotetraspora thailandica TaxID=487172 RepID=A0A8J4DGC2_9ACTN|nr:GNAT family N-acetyltransferase [Planotetraspora thailandica]GII59850.1 GNAT family acetyltransferase [Planotetraspora thailandica]
MLTFLHPQSSLAELSEAEAMYQFESSAPTAVRDALGIECVRLAGGVVLSMREDPVNYWSKALGFGFAGPVTADLIGEICDFYRSRKGPSAVLQFAPSVLPPDWEKIRAEYALSRGSSWVKLARDLSTDVANGPAGPPVERVGPQDAQEWASVLMRGFGMPEGLLVEMTAAFAAHPCFRAYVTRSGGEVVAAAGMYIGGETAQLLGAATLAPHRGRGAQTAMLRARIADATAAGCRVIFAETGAEAPGAHNTSLHNMARAGFVPLYTRVNWTLSAETVPGAEGESAPDSGPDEETGSRP